MRRAFIGLLGVVGSIVCARPLVAHHSFAAEFDGSRPITVQGTVTKVEWRNPHIWIYLDVRDANGSVTPWQCEGSAPNALTRQGWSRDSVKQGEMLTIEGYPAKNGTNTCNGRTWKLANGTTLFSGNADPR